MAQHMACDASYITAVADRLEELGLVLRRAAQDDRRAKELVLTRRGRTVADRLHRLISRPPEALLALSTADRAAFARIAAQLTAYDHSDGASVRQVLRA